MKLNDNKIEISFIKLFDNLEEELETSEKLSINDKLIYCLLHWYCVIGKSDSNDYSNDNYEGMLNVSPAQPTRSFKRLENIGIIKTSIQSGKNVERTILKRPREDCSFIPVTTAILKWPGLNSTDKAIYSLIRLYAEEWGVCKASSKDIAERLGINSRTVIRSVQTLEENGLIRTNLLKSNRKEIKVLIDLWKKENEFEWTNRLKKRELTEEERLHENLYEEDLDRLSTNDKVIDMVQEYLDRFEEEHEEEICEAVSYLKG